MSSEKSEIGKASAILAFFTFISRLLGLVRNQILSHYFGASFVADAFIAAFTIPNALRRLLGEGALTPSLVATLTRHLKTDDWKSFVRSAFAWLTIALLTCIGLGTLFAAPLVRLYVPDFEHIPGKFELTVQLTRFLFPFILFIGWSAFFMGVLNTFRSFALSAFVPAMNSIAVILIVPAFFFFFSWPSEQSIYVFSAAMLIGALAQATLQLAPIKKLDCMPSRKFKWKDTRVFELGTLLVPSFFSMAVYQLNIIVNRTFASQIDGAVSHLFYADLIIELPVALIATSVGTAVIPSFSRLIVDQKRHELAETFRFSVQSVWVLAFPCCAGLIVLAMPIVSTLYFTGRFQWTDTTTTASALIFYAVGLPFFSTLRIILGYFFADKETRLPFIAGLFALGVNFASAWWLSGVFQTKGIALATSISSAFNILILILFLKIRKSGLPFGRLLLDSIGIAAASLLMAGGLYILNTLVPSSIWEATGVNANKIITLFGLIIAGVTLYLVGCWLFRVPMAFEVFKRVGKKLKLLR